MENEITPIEEIRALADKKSLDNLQDEYLHKQVQDGKTLAEISKDFAHAKVTSEIFSDDKENKNFRKGLREEKKNEIVEDFKQQKIAKQAETIKTQNEKAEAFYKSVRPILEFDFTNLVGKANKSDEEVKTYADRAYGIPLMVLMLFLLTPIYCSITIVLAVLNGINSLFVSVSTFGKIAKGLSYSVLFIALALFVVYIVLFLCDKYLGTNILSVII